MSMSKKDYTLIANVLERFHNSPWELTLEDMVTSLSNELEKDNPNFDRGVFHNHIFCNEK